MNIINKYRRNFQFRRGMILLVVMAVLSFFAVLGMTFILMTGKNRDSAETAQLAAQNTKTAGNSPQELLEEGIMQVLVGPPKNGTAQSTKSALYGCDLIGDMYGAVDADNLEVAQVIFSSNKMTPCKAEYAGRVVTIAEGPFKGQSTIILNARGTIIPFASGIGGTEATSRVKCVINKKRAFQGSATKYDAMELNGDVSNDFMSLRYTGGATKNIRVGRVVVPSYYRGDSVRPGLNNNTELGGPTIYPALSNSSFASAASTGVSPWDVDNDGDGDKDSVWMNLGLPPRPMPDGTLVVPMYAILVEDLDGRLNVNTHSFNQTITAATTYSSMGTTTAKLPNNETLTPATMINGQGFGPAEVNMEALLGNVNTSVVSNRTRNNSEYIKYCFPEFTSLFTAPFTVSTTTTTTANKFFRSPLDFYGSMAGVIDQNGMFIWQKRGTVGSYNASSYERDLGSAQRKGRTSDNSANPYSPEELEGVLRAYDDDSKKTESRLLNLVRSASNMTAVRNLITTESWDMPYCDISGSAFTSTNLPEEVRAGFKMDINRPLTSYEDNPTVADTERTKLAKDLYYLIKAAGVTNSKVAAQWAVNAVDFRDADSVCTYLSVDNVTVWGCERPELLITETFAFHARMTEDTELGGWRSNKSAECGEGASSLGTSIDAEWYDPKDCPESPSSTDIQAFCTKYGLTYSPSNTGPIVAIMNRVRKNKGDGIADLDQVYKPESGLFIELYNPWISANSQESVNEYKNGGVPLGSVGTGAGSMVDSAWRIAVAGGKAGGINPAASWSEDVREKKYTINRVLYFGSTTPETGQFTYKANVSNICVKPGQFAIIGPTGNTILARKESDGSASRQINITSGSNARVTFDNTAYTNVCAIAVPNSGNARFSVTDIGTYTDATGNNGALTTPRDRPYDADDANRWTNLDGKVGKGLGDDFEQAGYRIVYLQRLANPYKAYNATTNPYITFDQMPVDLYCYNGRQCKFADYKSLAVGKSASKADEMACKHADFFMKSRQRGETQAFAGSTTAQLWSAEKMQGQTTLGAASSKLTAPTGSGNAALQSALKKDFYHSMTKLDQKLYKVVSTTVSTGTSTTSANLPSYESVAPYYFPNRPFNSVMELMLVPQVSAYELTSSVNAISKPTSAELTPGSLPKYLRPDSGYIDFLSETGSKILDYVRVQTPFVVTPLNINTYYVNDGNQSVSSTAAANGYRWSFREPGKININSITHPAVWAALLGAKTEAEAKAITGLTQNMYDEYWGKIFTDATPGTRPRTFGASSANYIAANYQIFKMNDTTKQSRSAANSVYFQTQLMQRLSNLTTTRSNVYAVWITVGFFELKGTPGSGGAGMSQYQVGREYGLDSGSRQRYRAFYIIDRTRPVGYSPGKRMNADKTIILRRYLP